MCFYHNCFNLFSEANKQKDLRLPIPVQFHLDDMANYAINDFASIIATARSRGIGITGCIQSKINWHLYIKATRSIFKIVLTQRFIWEPIRMIQH